MVVGIGATALFLALIYGGWAWLKNNAVGFYSPGPISQAHASIANDCTKCHNLKASQIPRTVTQSSMDAACLSCHVAYTLHRSNTVRTHACVQCHQEHVTSGLMLTVDSANCLSCHSDATGMQASAELGRSLPVEAFQQVPADGRTYYLPKRPADGYTTVMVAFDRGHPAFQIQRENLRDPNTLKFNHQRHFQADIPATAQGKLTCSSCHQPDANGAYMQPLSFEKNCASCHSLQFDQRNPDLTIPHGDAEKVSSFLRTLPLQYSRLAEKRGLQDQASIARFVGKQLTALREDMTTGQQLENAVFFSGLEYGPTLHVGQEKIAETRSGLTGCAYCHEVKESRTGIPLVTAPVIPDRWYSRSRFDHSKHINLACARCHEAEQSTKTSDILLPAQNNCLECHSTKGRVAQTCTTCHDYHAPTQTITAQDPSP